MGPWLAGPGAVSPEHIHIEGILSDLLPSLNPSTQCWMLAAAEGGWPLCSAKCFPRPTTPAWTSERHRQQATQAVRPDGAVYHVPIQDFDRKHSFDLVLCSEVLMHIPPNEIEQVAAEAAEDGYTSTSC